MINNKQLQKIKIEKGESTKNVKEITFKNRNCLTDKLTEK